MDFARQLALETKKHVRAWEIADDDNKNLILDAEAISIVNSHNNSGIKITSLISRHSSRYGKYQYTVYCKLLEKFGIALEQ